MEAECQPYWFFLDVAFEGGRASGEGCTFFNPQLPYLAGNCAWVYDACLFSMLHAGHLETL